MASRNTKRRNQIRHAEPHELSRRHRRPEYTLDARFVEATIDNQRGNGGKPEPYNRFKPESASQDDILSGTAEFLTYRENDRNHDTSRMRQCTRVIVVQFERMCGCCINKRRPFGSQTGPIAYCRAPLTSRLDRVGANLLDPRKLTADCAASDAVENLASVEF